MSDSTNRVGSKLHRRSFLDRTLDGLVNALGHALFAEEIAACDGLLQRLDPRVNIFGLLSLILAVSVARRLDAILAIFIVAVVLAALSGVGIVTLAKREWLAVFLFTGALALPALFLVPGPAIASLPVTHWTITATGLRGALFLIARVETAATLALLMVLTASWPRLMQAMRSLGMPKLVVMMIAMTHRYIYLMVQTARDMMTARRARLVGEMLPRDARRLAAANVGVLLFKTFELSNDVYLAMVSRGFTGQVYTLDEFQLAPRDWAGLAGFLAVALLAGWCTVGVKTNPTKTMTTPIFELRDASYSYGDIAAVREVSLTVERGQRIVVLGANGSGKSTLLKLLDGLYFPDRGEVLFDGDPLGEAALNEPEFAHSFRRRVGLVFQNPDVQLFNPTVFDELAFGPLQLRWPSDKIRRRVTETLEQLELGHLSARSPHRLSGGEKKRVALASVLIMDPEVLLLDEPTAGLDPKSQSQIIDFIAGWQGDKTVITSTHDLDIVADIADRCLIFQSGQLVASGTAAAVLDDLPLLERTHLIHAHRHRHASGLIHSHPHLHVGHDHLHAHDESGHHH